MLSLAAYSQKRCITTGVNSPIVFAPHSKISYDIAPSIIQAIYKLFDHKKLNIKQRREKFELLVKTFSNLPARDKLSYSDIVKLGITGDKDLINILNFTLFLKTNGNNSPIILTEHGDVQLWYGIPETTVRELYSIAEKQHLDNEVLAEALKQQILKYKSLVSQTNELSKDKRLKNKIVTINKLINKGKVNEAKTEIGSLVEDSELDCAKANNISALYLETLNDYNEAAKSHFKAYILRPDDVKYLNDYAVNLNQRCSFDSAILLYKSIISLANNKQDSLIFNAENNIGNIWFKKGVVDSALLYYQKSENTVFNLYGEKSRHLIKIYVSLALAYMSKSQYDSSISYSNKSLEISLNSCPQNLQSLSGIYNALGLAWRNIGMPDSALKYLYKSISIETRLYGDHSSKLATAFNNIALVYKDLGHIDEAIILFKKALQIYNPSSHESYAKPIATYTNNLGEAYVEIACWDSAMKYLEASVQTNYSGFKEDNVHTAVNLQNIATVLLCKTQYDTAIVLFSKAIDIYKKAFQEEHPDIAKCYAGLGISNMGLNNQDTALYYLEKALLIDLKKFPTFNINIARDYENIGLAFLFFKNKEKAFPYLSKTLSFYSYYYGYMHPKTQLVNRLLKIAS